MVEDIGGVIVAGAGPTGMVTAMGLASRGLKVTVLERYSEYPRTPRATSYTPPVLKVLDEFGVLKPFEKVALRSDGAYMYFKGADRKFELRFDIVKDLTPYHYLLQAGQDTLNDVVREELLKLPNTDVRWSHEITAIDQDKDCVTVTVETPDGEKKLRSEWLVGADGASSAVRQLSGLSFEGHTWPERFFATNVWLDLEDHGFGKATMVHDPVNWGICVKINKEGLWRVTYAEDPNISEEEARARIPEHYKQILPKSAHREKYDIHSCAPYQVHQRAANRFRVGRVILAGDAAHITNPCGGLGLSTGILDAKHVVDALAAITHGIVDDSVLDFYDLDRRRVYWEVTNSAATEHKRRLREEDPVRQAQDMGMMEAAIANPMVSRALIMGFFDAEGRKMPIPADDGKEPAFATA